jgi:hypothetical protein
MPIAGRFCSSSFHCHPASWKTSKSWSNSAFWKMAIPIRMIETDYQGIGIDTPEDLILVEKLFKGSPT